MAPAYYETYRGYAIWYDGNIPNYDVRSGGTVIYTTVESGTLADARLYVDNLYLPTSTWLCCPHCGEIEDVWRLGKTGVSEARYGTRVRHADPKRFKCNFCKKTFSSDGGTRREAMGHNSSGRDKVAI